MIGYSDRRKAGRILAQNLTFQVATDKPVVFGLVRGGVPVAYEVALLKAGKKQRNHA